MSPWTEAALEKLAADDRELVTLVAWESLTPTEAALVMKIRPGTARVRLHRARLTLSRDPGLLDLLQLHARS